MAEWPFWARKQRESQAAICNRNSLTQYIQTIIISTYNVYEKVLMRYFTFFFWYYSSNIQCDLYAYSTSQFNLQISAVLSSHM